MVYFINLKNTDDSFFEKIAEAEKIIFVSKKENKSNKLSVCGRVLLGYLLKTEYDINSFSYRYGENGKPYLENEDVFFSISHSGEYVVCCISDEEIGCDIENVKEYNPKISKRFFTGKEAEFLENNDNKEKNFARMWTRKESVLKKEGTGIGGGLQTYCFAENIENQDFHAHGYCFNCRSFENYELAVCSENGVKKIKSVTKEEFEEYINGLNSKKT